VSAIKVASRNGVKPFRDGSVSIDTVVARLKVGSLARRVSTFLRRRIGNEIRLLQTTASSLNPRARELVLRADKARDDADVAAQSHDTLEIARAITQLRSADSLLAIAEREDRAWLGPLIDRGWVALTIANLQSGAPRDSAFGSAMGHAARALGRNTRNAGALELRGTVFYSQAALLPLADTKFDDYLGRAAQDLEAALRVDSALASAWGTLSRVHVARGHVADAEQAARTALARDAYVKDAPSILQTLFGATLMRDSLAASWTWCERGSTDYPRDPRFVQCRLTLLAEDGSRKPDPKLAWALVGEANRLDPQSRAQAVGRPWFPIYRDMLGAVVSARAGDIDSARAVARRARLAVANDSTLGVDLKYEEALLSLVMGDRQRTLNSRCCANTSRLAPHWRDLSRSIRAGARYGPTRLLPRFFLRDATGPWAQIPSSLIEIESLNRRGTTLRQ